MTDILEDKKRHATALAYTYARYNTPQQLYNPENPSTWYELTNNQLDQGWAEHLKAKARYLHKARGHTKEEQTPVQTKAEVRS